MTPEIVADSTVSLAAACGLLLTMGQMRGKDPFSRRFRAALAGLAGLMLVRTLSWATGWPGFAILTTALAGCVPLLGLIVTEGLLRRHAPGVLKWSAFLGAIGFAIAATLPDMAVEPARTYLLVGFQTTLLAALGGLALRRDKTSLSPDENQAVDRLLLSLLLILPLIATDFRTPMLDIPVRLGGIAILGLAWLSLGLGKATSRPRAAILGFAGLFAMAVVTTLALALLTTLSAREAAQCGAIVLSALLVFAIGRDVQALRIEARAGTVLRLLAEASLASPAAFLAELQRRSGVEEAALLTAADLGDFDHDALRTCFGSMPVQTRASLLGHPADEQIVWLLERFEATHAMMIAAEPLTVLALNRPSIGGSEVALLELKAVQRMAALIAARA